MKWNRETDGYFIRSAMVKTSGWLTRPWIARRWSSGLISGTPLWCRS
jgi:hypothetical protein